MAVTIGTIGSLLLVAFLWGATNPLIKKGAKGVDNVKKTTLVKQFVGEISFLVTNLNYMIPFLVNQLGSVLYFLCLQGADLSLAVPVVNSLTFVFTALAGTFFGEQKPDKYVCIGVFLILLGTTCCCLDKLESSKSV